MGFYFAAIAISKDVSVRKSLKQFASRGSKLFDNLGLADIEQELQKRVTRIAKDHEESLQVQTGIRQQSIEEEEMKEYLEEAMNEVNRMKSGK
jgi:pseudouridine-5'-phosphate glycosidase